MTRTVEITLAIHVDNPGNRAIRVSDNGEDKDAIWLPRSCMGFMKLLGKTTRGVDRDGQTVDLPMMAIEVVEWKAKQAGWI